MKIRILTLGFTVLLSACQSALPFYSKQVEEPEWFKAKGAEANAKGYPAARAVPPNPKNLPTEAERKAQLKALQKAGDQVRNDPRAKLEAKSPIDVEAFAKEAQEETIVPPLVDTESRPD